MCIALYGYYLIVSFWLSGRLVVNNVSDIWLIYSHSEGYRGNNAMNATIEETFVRFPFSFFRKFGVITTNSVIANVSANIFAQVIHEIYFSNIDYCTSSELEVLRARVVN